MLTDDEHERRDAAIKRAAARPIPRELSRQIAHEIEPHTINAGIEHSEVMIAIEIAYPLIVDYLRTHPDNAPPPRGFFHRLRQALQDVLQALQDDLPRLRRRP